jgi:hypothetical protein
MQALTATRVIAALLAGAAAAAPLHAQVRISMVGKNSDTNVNAYDGQFVELYNASPSPASLNGMSVQVASSAGSSSWTKVDLSGSIAPGGYWLVRFSTHFPNTWGIPFVADQVRPVGFNGSPVGNTAMGNGGGKAVLADSTTLFTTNGCAAPNAAHVLDLVAWSELSSTVACHEGSALALIPRNAGAGDTSVTRRCGGQTGTNDNLNDFIQTARPPRNSMWTGAVNGPAVNGITVIAGKSGLETTTGYAGQTALFTTTPITCSGSISSVAINLSSIGGSAGAIMHDDGLNGDTLAGDGVYAFEYTLPSPPAAPLGTYTLPITATDSGGLSGVGLAPITVAPTPPSNDLCGNAAVIPAAPLPMFASAVGNLVSASPITLVGTSCTTNTGSSGTSRDVWYAFTPVESGAYTVTTCNEITGPSSLTGMSTNLSIFETCPPDNSTDLSGLSVACNTDGCRVFIGGGASTIPEFQMSAGTTYLIRVAKRGSGSSVIGAPFRLDILSAPFGACCFSNGTCTTLTQSACDTAVGVFSGAPTTCFSTTCPPAPVPVNDDCASATVLSPGVPAPGTSYGASGSDITTCDLTSWDVWYAYTPSATGPFQIRTTLLAGLQTPAIAVFGTCPPVTDASLACVGVPSVGNTNSLTFNGASGTPYYIRLSTNFSQRSEFSVVITTTGVCCRGATCNTTVAQADCTVSNGLAGASFSSAASTCNTAPTSNSPCCYADYNKFGGVAVSDIFDFLADWFAGSVYANTGGTGAGGSLSVQNIFDFLAAWFAGGC